MCNKLKKCVGYQNQGFDQNLSQEESVVSSSVNDKIGAMEKDKKRERKVWELIIDVEQNIDR